MRIVVDTLPPSGKRVTIGHDTEWSSSLMNDLVPDGRGEVQGILSFVPLSSGVRVTGHLAAEADHQCERCGAITHLSFQAEVDLKYLPEMPVADEVEVELTDDDLEVGWYVQGKVAVSDVVSEALALALPERLVCSDFEACDIRTAELLASARQHKDTGHPGFAALKNF